MSFIATPNKISKRGEFYHQLAVLISSGLPIIQGLQTIRRSPPDRSYRRPLSQILERLESGATFYEAVRTVPGWIPDFDQKLIEASENSGSLDACFRLLSDYCEQRAAMLKRVLSNLIYPLLVFHFAVLIFPLSLLKDLILHNKADAFLVQKFAVLLPIYLAGLALVYASQGHHGEKWRSLIERVTNGVPLVRTARKEYALARLSMSLEALIRAGVPIIQSWRLASESSGSPRLSRCVRQWIPDWDQGVTPGESLSSSRVFPDMFKNLYLTAENSGNLDETMHRLFLHYQEESSRKLETISVMAPRVLYFLIVIGVAYQVINFYLGYFDMIKDAGGF